MMQGYDMMSGWGGMWLGPIFSIAFLVLVVVLIVWLVGALTGNSSTSTEHGIAPRQILDERFAKGDIDKEEYNRRRMALES